MGSVNAPVYTIRKGALEWVDSQHSDLHPQTWDNEDTISKPLIYITRAVAGKGESRRERSKEA